MSAPEHVSKLLLNPNRNMMMANIRYKPPREVLGEYLARTFRDMRWETHYNETQKEYWYLEADKLLLKLRQWKFM